MKKHITFVLVLIFILSFIQVHASTLIDTTSTLKIGFKGDAVKALQAILKDHNLLPQTEKTDGIFGSKTLLAVQYLQKYLGLSADGIVGPKTLAMLNSATGTETLRWEPVTGASFYRIKLFDDQKNLINTFNNIKDVTYTLNNLKINSTYYYTLTAGNANGLGIESIQYSFRPKIAKIYNSKATNEYTGILVIGHGDIFGKEGFLSKKIPFYRLILPDESYLDLTFSGKELTDEEPLNNQQVTITGDLKGKELSVKEIIPSGSERELRTPATQDSRQQGYSIRQYKVATILFNFLDNDAAAVASYPASTAREYIYDNEPNNLYSIAGYFNQVSYGTLQFVGKNTIDGSGDVYGYYTLPHNHVCTSGYLEGYSEAEAIAVSNGFDPNGYDLIVLIGPSSGCAIGGWSNGSAYPRIYLANSSSSVIMHEIGHHLSLDHANSQDCIKANGTPEAYSFFDGGNCTFREYKDPFSVMGNGWDAKLLFSVFEKIKLGFIAGNDITTLGPTQSGTFDLYSQGISRKALRFPTTDRFGYFRYLTLEFRRPLGVRDNFPITDPVVNGISLRIDNQLIDTTPNTSPNIFQDAPLTAGQSYTDPGTGRVISVLAVNPPVSISSPSLPRAVVSISAATDIITPTASITSPADNSMITIYTTTITAYAMDNIYVAGVQFYKDADTVPFATDTSFPYSTGLQFSQGTHTIFAEAYDRSGNIGTSATITLIPDTIAPSISVTSPTDNSTVSSTSSTTINASATDNISVSSVKFYKDADTVPFANDTSSPYSVTRTFTSGNHAIYAKAYDLSGNIGVSGVVNITAN